MTALQHLARAAAWLVVALVVVGTLVQPGGPLAQTAFAAEALVVTGAADGLQSGRPGTLTLTISNPTSEPAVVRRLDARVTGGGSTDCGTGHLTVTPWTGELLVPAGGAASADLSLAVAADAACSGQTWDLEYDASP